MYLLETVDIAVIVIGCFLLLAWIFLYVKGRKEAQLFMILNDEDFPLKDIYFVGYAYAEITKVNYQGEGDRRNRKLLAILYGNKYVDYYIRALYAQRYTMMLTLACLAMPAYCITQGSIVAFIIVLIIAVFSYYYYGKELPNKIEERNLDMISDFSEVVSKLALMVNAGMILHDAWEMIAESDNTIIYQEMQESVREMKNGRPEVEALFAFGQRCMLPEIKKFSTTLIQGMTKGNAELAIMLKQQSKEVWVAKQQIMRRKGELANDKLLFPIFIVFIGILIMVLIPIFSGIGI